MSFNMSNADEPGLDSPVCVYRLIDTISERLKDDIRKEEEMNEWDEDEAWTILGDTLSPEQQDRYNRKLRRLYIIKQNFEPVLRSIFEKRNSNTIQTFATVHRMLYDAMRECDVHSHHRAYVQKYILDSAIAQVAQDFAQENEPVHMNANDRMFRIEKQCYRIRKRMLKLMRGAL